tara:strand:- start:638 stop:937 length:300 start_codon:yes stop_codon:yes gene_type:complete
MRNVRGIPDRALPVEVFSGMARSGKLHVGRLPFGFGLSLSEVVASLVSHTSKFLGHIEIRRLPLATAFASRRIDDRSNQSEGKKPKNKHVDTHVLILSL